MADGTPEFASLRRVLLSFEGHAAGPQRWGALLGRERVWTGGLWWADLRAGGGGDTGNLCFLRGAPSRKGERAAAQCILSFAMN